MDTKQAKNSAVRFIKNRLVIIDQTALPEKIIYRRLNNYRQVALAIKKLAVRGAPLIGVAAAYGLAIESLRRNISRKQLLRSAKQLKSARPTAVNLTWAINRRARIINNPEIADNKLTAALISEAKRIDQQEHDHSHRIGEIGARLVKNNMTIMTICNTGWLAAPGIGTALGVIYTAHKQGKKINVLVLETRPLLQGARLTAFELDQAKIPYTLITDNMMASMMNKVDIVFAGADRIARNGDTANKIGTLTLAITANYYEKPFYVVAPSSTFDLTLTSGKEITIEQRDKKEVIYFHRQMTAPKNARASNPAFDVTPHKLITGIITEKGILKPPFKKTITAIKNEKPNI
jgi:methylthioribose-1-phosphate isomerase